MLTSIFTSPKLNIYNFHKNIFPGSEVMKFEGLALTPPMGWNSFNTFGCEPNEQLVMEITDAMVSTGLKDMGYTYINIDDGWMTSERDAHGNLIPNPGWFPNGLKYVTDYIHSKGLKAGIYLGCGLLTYNDKPGSLGYEQQDADLIAAMGFDLLKYDRRCLPEDPPGRSSKTEYILMSQALRNTGRPILFSLCEHGGSEPWTWAAEVGHMWRTTPDIKDCFEGEYTWGWSLNKIIDHTCHLHSYAGPDHWNDPDMLIVGLHGNPEWQGPGCTDTEYRSHFSLWCLSAAPLLIGCDIRKMDPITREILSNPEIIAINQDPLGKQGYRINKEHHTAVWIKPLSGGAWAVGLYNRDDSPQEITVHWSELGIAPDTKASLRDIWARKDQGQYSGSYTRDVAPHECIVVKIKP
jgi:alpha-galactosidase